MNDSIEVVLYVVDGRNLDIKGYAAKLKAAGYDADIGYIKVADAKSESISIYGLPHEDSEHHADVISNVLQNELDRTPAYYPSAY